MRRNRGNVILCRHAAALLPGDTCALHPLLGAGGRNRLAFPAVPLRWVGSTAIVMSLVGEVGGLGGGVIPNVMGYSKQHLGSYQYGYIVWGMLAIGIFIMYMVVKRQWERTWVGAGGKALHKEVK